MFGRGAAPLPMFGWWCNLPDCLCGDSPPRLSFERGSKPCSCSEGKVSSPMFGYIGRVSGAIASFRKPPLPCVSGASLPFTSAHASFRIKPALRFRHQAIALFRNYRSALETIASFRIRYRLRCRKLPRTQKPFRAEPRTFSTPSCDIQPCPRKSNQQ